MPETIVSCPLCEGSDKINCERCNGTGQEPILIQDAKRCLKCGGTGKMKCPRCNGTGKIYTWNRLMDKGESR